MNRNKKTGRKKNGEAGGRRSHSKEKNTQKQNREECIGYYNKLN